MKGRALRALSTREYSRVELARKLAPHVASADEAVASSEPKSGLDELLDELQAKGFLSDERAAQSLLHRRAPKLGAQRVLGELRAKGVNAQAVAQVASQLRETELERATAVWTKKFGNADCGTAVDAAQQGKQMRFLAARGFSGDIIKRVLQSRDKDVD